MVTTAPQPLYRPVTTQEEAIEYSQQLLILGALLDHEERLMDSIAPDWRLTRADLDDFTRERLRQQAFLRWNQVRLEAGTLPDEHYDLMTAAAPGWEHADIALSL